MAPGSGVLGILLDHSRDYLSKALNRVRLGEERDWRSSVLGLKASRAFGGDEHDTRREMWPTLLDTPIQLAAVHARHSDVAEDHVIAPASE